jgi:hypothetical protein
LAAESTAGKFIASPPLWSTSFPIAITGSLNRGHRQNERIPMKRTQARWSAAIVLGLTFFLVLQSALGQEDVGKAIYQTILKNLKAGQARDLPAMMKTIHSQSPVYQSTKEKTPAIFKAYKLDYQLLYYKYIGRDGEYAFARTRHRTRKISGPALPNNEIDAIQIFRQEKGEWKLWNEAILEVHYLK